MRAFIFLAWTILNLQGYSSVLADPRLGVLVPRSGQLSVPGEEIHRGVRLALRSTKADVYYADSGSDSGQKLLTAYQRMAQTQKVPVIIGPATEEQTLALAPLAMKDGVVLITQAQCSPKILQYPLVLCAYPSWAEQLRSVEKIFEAEGIHRLLLLSESTQEVAELKSEVRDFLRRRGATFLEISDAKPGAAAYKSRLELALASGVDAVFLLSADLPGLLRLAIPLRSRGFSKALFANLDLLQRFNWQFSSGFPGRLYLAGVEPVAFEAEFSRIYKDWYGKDPSFFAALGYQLASMARNQVERGMIGGGTEFVNEVVRQPQLRASIPGFLFDTDRSVKMGVGVREVNK